MFVKWISQCSFNQKRLVCNKRMFYLSRRRRIIQIYLRRQDNNSKKRSRTRMTTSFSQNSLNTLRVPGRRLIFQILTHNTSNIP